jgi:probable F420-dependent oxidoreductase
VTKPRLSLTMPVFGTFFAQDELHRVLDFARAADAAGIGALKFVDHVVLGRDTSEYVWGGFTYGVDTPWLEPMVTVSAVAAVTEQVLLETAVVIAPMRPAVVLAKQAATVDVLSRGRLRLGVGTGWQPAEIESAGVPYEERGPRLTETMEACRVLWRDSPASYDGRFVSFREVHCEPRPASGSIPVWFSGPLNRRTLRRVVELGEGWLPIMDATPEQIAADVARLRDAYAAAGRDPAALDVSFAVRPQRGPAGGRDLDRTLELALELGEAGVTFASLFAPAFTTADDAGSWVEDVGRRWNRL